MDTSKNTIISDNTFIELLPEHKATLEIFADFTDYLCKNNITCNKKLNKKFDALNRQICKKYKINNVLKKSTTIKKCYEYLVENNIISGSEEFELFIRGIASKSTHGIIVLSTALDGRMPDDYTLKNVSNVDSHIIKNNIMDIENRPILESKETGGCKNNCSFCPFETKERNYKLNTKMNATDIVGITDIEDISSNGCNSDDVSELLQKLHKKNKMFINKDDDGNVTGVTIARSYLTSEGVWKRALLSEFLPDLQVFRRLIEIECYGHKIDKLVFIPRGATFSNFNPKYLETYLTYVFWACNEFHKISTKFNGIFSHMTQKWLDKNPFLNSMSFDEDSVIRNMLRPMGTLDEEKRINETAPNARIVEIAFEDRPDSLNNNNIISFYRRLGCTSFETGIQHTSNRILKINNRGHNVATTIKCMNKISDNYFKTHGHLMFDLMGSSPVDDFNMLLRIYTNEDIVFYNCKVYPCLPIPFAKVYDYREKWLDMVKNFETTKINNILEQMRDDNNYHKLSSSNYIWAPYAETNYDDFLRIITIACAGVSRDDFIHFNMPIPVEFDEKVRVKGDTSFLKDNNIDLNNTPRKLLSPPTERKSRIQRDFPEGTKKNSYNGFISNTQVSNLGQLIRDNVQKEGWDFFDIRSREINNNIINNLSDKARLYVRSYRANGGTELCISIEVPKENPLIPDDAYLLGLGRVRFRDYDITTNYEMKNNKMCSDMYPKHYLKEFTNPRKIIVGITELHIYGNTQLVNDKKAVNSNGQHKGIGKFILSIIEEIVRDLGFQYLCVISGVGVRNYYRNNGYHDMKNSSNEYLLKDLNMQQKRNVCNLFGQKYYVKSILNGVRNFINIQNSFRCYNDFIIPNMDAGTFIYNHPMIQKGNYETLIVTPCKNLTKVVLNNFYNNVSYKINKHIDLNELFVLLFITIMLYISLVYMF